MIFRFYEKKDQNLGGEKFRENPHGESWRGFGGRKSLKKLKRVAVPVSCCM
jgi:hypothetical protein|nr:MAG TPA: hypothetical protein [Caudoviricetes sp.]DAH81366.1 MAG TPA: hypothetical protein [Caudoviricetes sp.]